MPKIPGTGDKDLIFNHKKMKKLIAPVIIGFIIIIYTISPCLHLTSITSLIEQFLRIQPGTCKLFFVDKSLPTYELTARLLLYTIVVISIVILFFTAVRKYKDLQASNSKINNIATIILTIACLVILSPVGTSDMGAMLAIITLPLTVILGLIGIILFTKEIITARKDSNKSLRTTIDLMTHLYLIILWGGTLLYGMIIELDNQPIILILLPFIASGVTTLILTAGKEKQAQPPQ